MDFINFIHRPEVYAQFLDTFRFPAGVNPEAAQYTTTTPMYEVAALANCEIKDDIGEGLAKWDALWQDIRYTD
jgi:spermidine/putrescine transport system substrate-binding protein